MRPPIYSLELRLSGNFNTSLCTLTHTTGVTRYSIIFVLSASGTMLIRFFVHQPGVLTTKVHGDLFILSDQCRTLKFSPTKAFIGRRLINHVIRVSDVSIDNFCMALCYMEPNCVSFNLKLAASDNGNHKCELNNSTHEGYENDLSQNPNYKYHGAEVRNIILHLKHSLFEKISLRLSSLLFFNAFQFSHIKSTPGRYIQSEVSPQHTHTCKKYTHLQKQTLNTALKLLKSANCLELELQE